MKNGSQSPHVCVIGLDGGTFRIIDYLVALGRLPNFATFLERGSRAILKSTVPAVTPAAWSAFSTGTNPGKTGIVDFFKWTPDEQKVSYVNATSVNGKHIWTVASETGSRVCVYNVPVTYPARQVNGIFVSGMDAPRLDERAVYPREFSDDLLSEIPDFSFSPDIDPYFLANHHVDPVGEFSRQLKDFLQMELKTLEYLWALEPWDLFVSVIRTTDIFQHQFMKPVETVIDNKDPVMEDDKRRAEFVFSCYEEIDAMLGRIRKSIESRGGNLILMSDHGFNSLEKKVSLNRVLEDAGLLTFRNRNSAINSSSSFLKKQILKCISAERKDKIKRIQRKISGEHWMKTHADIMASHIDLEKTKAFVIGQFGCLYINHRRRNGTGVVNGEDERQAVLKEVECAMEALTDPDDGKKVVVSALRREQVYDGPQLENLPDMVIQMRDSYHGIFAAHEMDQDKVIVTSENPYAKLLTESGTHNSDGILVMYGANIRNKDISTAQITDIAPTIFKLMGIEDLKEFDGNVIADALINKQGIVLKKIASPVGHDDQSDSESDGYSKDDEEEIRKRLENLGYL